MYEFAEKQTASHIRSFPAKEVIFCITPLLLAAETVSDFSQQMFDILHDMTLFIFDTVTLPDPDM